MSFLSVARVGGRTKSKHRIMCKVDVSIISARSENGGNSLQRMFQWEMNIVVET